jgi:hypothetical protein
MTRARTRTRRRCNAPHAAISLLALARPRPIGSPAAGLVAVLRRPHRPYRPARGTGWCACAAAALFLRQCSALPDPSLWRPQVPFIRIDLQRTRGATPVCRRKLSLAKGSTPLPRHQIRPGRGSVVLPGEERTSCARDSSLRASINVL